MGCLVTKNRGTPGFPDITIYVDRGQVLLVEFKRDERSQLSLAQQGAITHLSVLGHKVIVVANFYAFKKDLFDFMVSE